MFDRASTLGETLESSEARSVLDRFVPGFPDSPMARQFRDVRLGALVALVPGIESEEARERLWGALADVEDGVDGRPPYPPAIAPAVDYEPPSVPTASAALEPVAPTAQWGVVEVVLRGPAHGNPFVDVELTATFRQGGIERVCGGFYDGDGVYRIRLLAEEVGLWEFETASNARSLDGVTGLAQVVDGPADAHGPVRVDGFHFVHADGTRYRPLGTTAYAWTHQGTELERQTLATLAASPFTKLRMCLFPKSYLYNDNEPKRFPFPGSAAEGFDLERFDVRYFHDLEQHIRDLARLGIEADLILFHAYDRWGFSDLGPAVDDRFTSYVVRRLAAFANVWWSLANEFDLLWSKSIADWERLAEVVVRNDPHEHLLSIHNCQGFYDYSRPWITHASMQRVDVYRTAENTDDWRELWGKPVVIDECAYEGDIDQGWGNITGEEMVRRFWEGAVRGGYVGHGETYLNDREELWWSKGGELVGTSPARIGFLERVLADSPTGVLDPLHSEWDVPWGGVGDDYLVGYFGFNRPRFRNVVLPEGRAYRIDVIDTWGMSIDPVPGVHHGSVRVELPGRQYMAIRLVAVDGDD